MSYPNLPRIPKCITKIPKRGVIIKSIFHNIINFRSLVVIKFGEFKWHVRKDWLEFFRFRK